MTADEIRAAIQADGTMLDMARQPDPDTTTLAQMLSVGLKRVQTPHMISARGIAGKYGGGAIAAEVVLIKLEGARDAMLQSNDPGTKVFGSLLRRQLGFLNSDGLDFGDPTLRGQIDDLAAKAVITSQEAAYLKALAEVPDTVTEFDVRCALFADDGSLRV